MSSSLHAPPPPPISPPARLAARVFCALVAASVLFSVSLTRNWGITQDTPLIHYVVFLMAHGFAPYRDIVEMNMPGSYMTEWAVMHILGTGDIAWRSFDLILMAVAAIAAWSILRPGGKFPAFLAAATITLYHLGGGRSDVGQRDYTMAVLLLLGCAFLLHALRRSRPWLFAPFAASMGWAAAIKPTVVPFAFLVLVVAVLSLRMRRLPLAPCLLWALLGALLPTLLVAGFLSHYHAWPAFLDLLGNLAPYHRGNGNLPLRRLILRWLPWTYYPLALALLVLAFLMRSVRVLDNALLAAFFLFGVACYIYQGKGWNYHASTAMLFLVVLCAALSAASSRSVIAAALLAFAVFLPAAYTPIQIWRHGRVPDFAYQASLGNSLNALGGPALSGKIQCLDWNAGCIDVLYRRHIVQSTGYIYDFYLFPAHPAPVTAALQARFLAAIETNPPRVIVLTNHDWPAMQGFAKLHRWPAFELWLNQHYTLSTEQWPTARAYRIYLLKS